MAEERISVLSGMHRADWLPDPPHQLSGYRQVSFVLQLLSLQTPLSVAAGPEPLAR